MRRRDLPCGELADPRRHRASAEFVGAAISLVDVSRQPAATKAAGHALARPHAPWSGFTYLPFARTSVNLHRVRRSARMMVKGASGIVAADVQTILDDVGTAMDSLRGTTLLVTGGSGFLCSYFVETIAALNARREGPPCRLIVVDNLRTGIASRLAHLADRADIQFVQQDVSAALDLGETVDWIIHGASIASPTFYRRYPLETIDANVTGTRRLLDLARNGARGVLYLSTSEVYGDPDPACIPTPEDYRGNVSCTGPRACYDESKRLAETLCVTYHQLYGVPVKIARPFNVYGPRQRLDDRRIIPDLMACALRRQPLVLFS